EKASALFNRLGLHDFENYMPQKVSGGMRQRYALVRTLMFEHELVLLDKPISSLDAITRRSLQGLILLLQSEFKKTILMITHDIEEALLMSDELLVLTPMPMRIRERFVLEMPKPGRSSNPELLKIKEHVLEELEGDLGETI
ncbi:MAG: ABC transporter ATP-binding protein, partial [Deltaproteobacteria bacterium]|nr:ABC transporter ATP-binding protein [Deltaproteobacteria bacterium]